MRGKSGYVPFWPGGLENLAAYEVGTKGANLKDLKGLRTIPPSFSRGLRFPGEPTEDEEANFNDLDQTSYPFKDNDNVSLRLILKLSRQVEM